MEGAASESPGLQQLHVSISLGFSAALGEHRREGFLLPVRCPRASGLSAPCPECPPSLHTTPHPRILALSCGFHLAPKEQESGSPVYSLLTALVRHSLLGAGLILGSHFPQISTCNLP